MEGNRLPAVTVEGEQGGATPGYVSGEENSLEPVVGKEGAKPNYRGAALHWQGRIAG